MRTIGAEAVHFQGAAIVKVTTDRPADNNYAYNAFSFGKTDGELMARYRAVVAVVCADKCVGLFQRDRHYLYKNSSFEYK